MKRFIVIDGLDGSGKDTQANLIKQEYLKRGETVILRSHPSSDNFYGINAKKALLGKGRINKIKASLYYAFDIIRSVKLYYNQADSVIFVRYLMGVAYLPFPLAKIFYKFFESFLPKTKYMFFLDISPKEAISRLQSREDIEMFENFQDLVKVRKKALKLASKWYIIDADGDVEQIQKQIIQILDKP